MKRYDWQALRFLTLGLLLGVCVSTFMHTLRSRADETLESVRILNSVAGTSYKEWPAKGEGGGAIAFWLTEAEFKTQFWEAVRRNSSACEKIANFLEYGLQDTQASGRWHLLGALTGSDRCAAFFWSQATSLNNADDFEMLVSRLAEVADHKEWRRRREASDPFSVEEK